jgi:hypothetical protein
VITVVAALALFAGSPAEADTVYLKNGRTIQTDWTRIEGEYLVLVQYGGEVRIPLHAVERVESDEETSPPPLPTPSQAEYREALVRRYAEAGLSSPVRDAGNGPAPTGGDGPSRAIPAEPAGHEAEDWRNLSPDTHEYWQLRMAEIRDRIAVIESEIDRLPKYNHFEEKILDGRILWVVQEKERLEGVLLGLQADLGVVREDARKAGIPPGWLRLPSGER